MSSRAASLSCTRIGIWRSPTVNLARLASMSPIVAMRSVSDIVGRRDAELGQAVEVRLDDDLRPVEGRVRGDRAELAGRRHLALDLARLLVEHGAVGAHHAEGQRPLAAVVDEIGAQVGDRLHLVQQERLDLVLRHVALGFVLEVGDHGGAARLERAGRAGAADDIDVLDLGHFAHQRGRPRRSWRACPRAGCRAAARARR